MAMAQVQEYVFIKDKIMEEIIGWLINWFVENSDFSKEVIENNLDSNYFEQGWIDSFSFINFISDMEEKFDISFSNDEFQNREFATVNGLAKIIEGKVNG